MRDYYIVMVYDANGILSYGVGEVGVGIRRSWYGYDAVKYNHWETDYQLLPPLVEWLL